MSAFKESFESLRGGGRGWALVFIAGSWLFINSFRVLLPALIPQIKVDFGVGNAGVGFAMTVLWITYAGIQFPGGMTADKTGERTLLAGGVFLSALSLSLFFYAPTFAIFLVACALFGLGSGFYGTPRDMLLSRIYPKADSLAYAVTFSTGSLGAALLPYVGTVLARRWSWQVAVISLLPFAIVVAIGLWKATPGRNREQSKSPLDTVLTIRRTLKAMTHRPVIVGAGMMFISIFTFQALISFIPTYIVEVKHLNQQIASLLFGLFFIAGAIFQPLGGHLTQVYGEKKSIFWLIVLATASLLLLPLVGGFLAISVIVPLLGIRMAIGPLLSAFIVRQLPPPIQGTGWGLLRTVIFGFGALGSTMLGALADAGLFDFGIYILVLMTGLSGLLWVAISKPRSAVSMLTD